MSLVLQLTKLLPAIKANFDFLNKDSHKLTAIAEDSDNLNVVDRFLLSLVHFTVLTASCITRHH